MSNFLRGILKILGVTIGAFVIAVIAGGLLSKQEVDFTEEIITDSMTLAIFGILMLLFVCYLLDNSMKGASFFTGSKKQDNKQKQFFDSKFLTVKELNKITTFAKWADLKSVQDGILVRAEAKGSSIDVNLRKPIHTMVIGTTGSGKTTMFVDPFIQILSETKTRPSIVVTDPKGELYANHAYKLKKKGYNVKVLNLRDVFSSTRWNPMGRAYDIYQRAMHIDSEVVIHKQPMDKNCKLTLATNDKTAFGDEWYEFNGTAYADKQSLMNDVMSFKKVLISDAQEDLKDIAMTLVPVENQNDPSWEMGAQGFAQAVLYAMLEDSADPKCNMTRDKFTLYNFGKIAFYRDLDPDDQFKTLKKYLCQGRDKFSEVPQLANTVVGAAPNTARSYVSVLSTKLGLLSDNGICYATSADEMEFEKFDEQPTAFFIIIPDEKQTRHGIATLCIVQLYKILIELANKNPKNDRKLSRNTYFIMDEFGNLPKINLLDKIITVGRSRGIFMVLVVQSYTQLNNIYGDKVADIVRTNCNIQVFIGTTDQRTKEEFSKMCGNITVKTTSKTKGEKDSKSESTSETSRPLIYPEELELLPKNTCIVKMYHENPVKAVFTPAYAVKKLYEMKALPIEYSPARTLDEARIFYDIEARNNAVLKQSASFDDFDF